MMMAKRPQPMQVFISPSEENVHFKFDKKTPENVLACMELQTKLSVKKCNKCIQKRHQSKCRKTPFISVPAGLPAVKAFNDGDVNVRIAVQGLLL